MSNTIDAFGFHAGWIWKCYCNKMFFFLCLFIWFSKNLDAQTVKGNTALHYCCLHNKTECLKLLLRAKANAHISKWSYHGCECLHTWLNHQTRWWNTTSFVLHLSRIMNGHNKVTQQCIKSGWRKTWKIDFLIVDEAVLMSKCTWNSSNWRRLMKVLIFYRERERWNSSGRRTKTETHSLWWAGKQTHCILYEGIECYVLYTLTYSHYNISRVGFDYCHN